MAHLSRRQIKIDITNFILSRTLDYWITAYHGKIVMDEEKVGKISSNSWFCINKHAI